MTQRFESVQAEAPAGGQEQWDGESEKRRLIESTDLALLPATKRELYPRYP